MGLSKQGVMKLQGTRSFCGSVAFIAPEILQRRPHNHTVDIYGLGVLLFALLTGRPPFYDKDRDTIFKNIQYARLDIPSIVSQPAKALIEAVMDRHPSRRLGATCTQDVQKHRFFAAIDFHAVMRREVTVQGAPASPAAAQDRRSRSTASPGRPENPLSEK